MTPIRMSYAEALEAYGLAYGAYLANEEEGNGSLCAQNERQMTRLRKEYSFSYADIAVCEGRVARARASAKALMELFGADACERTALH